jgi:hypothetical protein
MPRKERFYRARFLWRNVYQRCYQATPVQQASLNPRRFKEAQMANQTAEHNTRAAERSGHAQKHHQQAAKHHESGNHEKATHHAQVAQGHQTQATHHANEAAKSHGEHHGNKE